MLAKMSPLVFLKERILKALIQCELKFAYLGTEIYLL